MSKVRTVSLNRTVTKYRTVTIPSGFGIFPDDVLRFGQLEDGTITMIKLVDPSEQKIEQDIKQRLGI